MSQLTGLALDTLTMVRTACILASVTYPILLARLNAHPGTRHNTRSGPAKVPSEAAATPPRSRTRLSSALRGAWHTARVATAIATTLSWLHQIGAL